MITASGFRQAFSSLYIYNYRLYWLGQLVSFSGTWMQSIAQAWLVLQLTNSPAALGTVTMLQFLPITLFTLFGGVLADRLPKRRVLFFTQSVAASQALLLAFLVFTNLIQLWHLYILALTLGIINAFDQPTRQVFVVEMVGKEQLPNAVALNSMLFNTGRIVGPAIGGLAINAFGLAGAFLLNGLSFFAVIASLSLMRPAEFRSTPQVVSGNVVGQILEGLAYAVRTPSVFLIVILTGALGLFGYNFTVMLPLIARFVLHIGPGGLGVLTSAMGVGSLIAAFSVAYVQRATLPVLFGGALVFSTMLLLVGASTRYPLTVGLLFVLGMASIAFSSTANTRIQLAVPNELRGRIMSLYFLLFAGSTPIGGMIVGTLAARAGVQPAVMLAATACLVGIAVAGGYARRMGSRPAPPTGDAAPWERTAEPATPAVRPSRGL